MKTISGLYTRMRNEREGDFMVFLKLLSNENGIIRYSYKPESNGKRHFPDGEDEYYEAMAGVLRYDSNTNTAEVEKVAEKDITSTFYRSQAFRMIRENIADLPKERILTWY